MKTENGGWEFQAEKGVVDKWLKTKSVTNSEVCTLEHQFWNF